MLSVCSIEFSCLFRVDIVLVVALLLLLLLLLLFVFVARDRMDGADVAALRVHNVLLYSYRVIRENQRNRILLFSLLLLYFIIIRLNDLYERIKSIIE